MPRSLRWFRPLSISIFPILLATLAWAGFDHPRGLPDNRLQIDAAPLGKQNGPASPETIQKLRARFGLTSDAAAIVKLTAMRNNVRKIIDLVKCEDASIGACLEKQYDEGRVCVELKPGNASRIRNDTSMDCNAEPVNFPVLLLPCQDKPISDGLMVYLFFNALHEAQHALQDFDPGVVPTDDSQRRVAKAKLKQACNESDAEDLENAAITRLKAALESVQNGQGVPTNATGAIKKIADSVAALPALARAQALQNLLKLAVLIRTGNDKRKQSEQVTKTNMQAFLSGTQTWTQAWGAIRRGRVWTSGPKLPGSQNPIDFLYSGDPGSGFFSQTDGAVEQSFDTLLDGTTGAILLAGNTRVLVVGNDDVFGDGVVLGYEDTDADGFFEAETRRELIRTFELWDGTQLVDDPVSDDVLAYSLALNEVVRLIDTDNDGWPDQPEGIGSIDFGRPELTAFFVSEDGNTAYAEPLNPYGDVLSYSPGLEGTRAGTDIDGFFFPLASTSFFDDAVFGPVILGPLDPGDIFMGIDAPPNVWIEIFEVAGTSEVLIGQGLTDVAGQVSVALDPPLAFGAIVIARNQTDGIPSIQKLVPEPAWRTGWVAGLSWVIVLGRRRKRSY